MGRRGGGMGGMRGGGYGRSGGMRSGGAGRSLGGGAGRAGRGALGGAGRVSAPRGGGFTPRPAAPRRGGGLGGFGLGLGTGLALGGGRRRGWGRWGGGWGFGGRRGMGMGGPMGAPMGPARGGCGCGTIFVIVIVLIIVLAAISLASNFVFFTSPQITNVSITGAVSEPTHVTPSTREREPLPANAANDVGPMFTDHLNWIDNPTQMQAGLRNFHQATGVRPHVYIIGEINGNTSPTNAQVGDFAIALYDQLFDDEAHLLFVFFESGDWPNNTTEIFAQPGTQARLVMDGEALDILFDYIEFYNSQFFTTDGFSMEQVFSNSFDQTAQRIMHRAPDNRPVWIAIIVVAGVVLLAYLSFNWWQRKQAQKNLEAEQTERILNQTLDTFGDDEAARLAKQYENEN